MKSKDPLFEELEKLLFQLDGNAKTDLEQKLMDEYLANLKEQKLHVPFKFKDSFIEDLKAEIRKITKDS